MAFIVEDGSGKKEAQSYTTEAFFRAYFLARNIDVTSLSQTIVEALLTKGTDYIDTRWGLRFLGSRLFSYLYSRSVFTLTDQPANNETVTVGSAIATFKTVPAVDTEAEIGDSLLETLNNLATAINNADKVIDADDQVIADFLIADPDVADLTIFVVRDGVATTEAVTNGSFDVATSAGYSGRPQVLEFPRQYLYDRTGLTVEGIPVRLKEATCEYAYRANTAVLSPDPTVDPSGLRVTSTRKKVGPIETSTQFAEQTTASIIKPYPAADRLLQEYRSIGGVIRA